MAFTLIYFKGCPNYEPARTMLKDLNLTLIEICQDDLAEGDSQKGYSSPTLLKDERIIFGSKVSGKGGCLLKLPSKEELIALLKTL